ncbi:MAG: hypothetical protein AAF585_09845, partial [Verrucomicrobiota bacterium]
MRRFLKLLVVMTAVSAVAQDDEQPNLEEERAERYAEAAASIDADLQAELTRLAEVRAKIAEERPALARKTNQIAAELREKRRQAELSDQKNEDLELQLRESESDIRVWRDEQAYIRSLLDDYGKQFESQISLAELEHLGQQLQAGRVDSATLEAELDVIDLAFDRIETARGGQTIDGKVIGPDGSALQGQFVQMGPVSWFAADEGGIGGIVRDRPDLQPEIAAGTGDAKSLAPLLAGETASPLIDTTMGTALEIGHSDHGFVDHIKDGGFWIYPILLLALVAIAAAIFKWVEILKIRELKPTLVREIVEAANAGELKQAQAELESVRHPAKALLARGVEVADQSREVVEEAM